MKMVTIIDTIIIATSLPLVRMVTRIESEIEHKVSFVSQAHDSRQESKDELLPRVRLPSRRVLPHGGSVQDQH